MNTLRAAAQQALEALEEYQAKGAPFWACDAAVAALRAALAEPVQEPFGYLWPTGRHPEFRFTQQKRDGVDGIPLYTAPPQRKPLTEEEIKDCETQAMVNGALPFEQRVFFARAIERAHGVGGNDE